MKKYISWILVVILAMLGAVFASRQVGLKRENKEWAIKYAAISESVAIRDSLIALDERLFNSLGSEEGIGLLLQFAKQNTDSALMSSVDFRIEYLKIVQEHAQTDSEFIRNKDIQITRLKRLYDVQQVASREQQVLAVKEIDSLRELHVQLEGQVIKMQRELGLKNKVKVISFTGLKSATVNYMGEVVDGKANGGGIGIWTTGSVYRGEWRNNLRHGKGSFQWKDGERFEGDYVDGKREGEGTYYWPSGERYEGQWVADQRTGQGTLFDLDGNVRYKGEWLNDVPANSK